MREHRLADNYKGALSFRSLTSVLVALLVAIVAVIASVASGTTVAEAQNRIAANNLETAAAVETAASVPAGHVGFEPVVFDDFVSGCCVAPNSSRDGLLGPGPHADRSIPGDGTRDFTRSQRDELNEIMGETGCHRCGTKDPGTKSGDAIPDHQPPLSLSDGPFELYPHCLSCSREQGLAIARLKRLGLLE